MTARHLSLVALAALAVAGCQDPYSDGASSAQQDRGPAPPQRTTSGGADGVAREFAALWSNWTWRAVDRQQRRLARLAAPGLARQLEANATGARIDATLRRDRPAARGTVAIVEVRATASTAQGLVVTREQTSTNGRTDLGGLRYRVYRVAAELRDGVWKVSRWQPQP